MFENLPITPVRAKVLATRLIPDPHEALLSDFAGKAHGAHSFGLLTSDFDHALFVALDEATKASPVRVLYTRSFYAGLSRTQDSFTGEALGILAGADDEIVREGLKAAIRTLESGVAYYRTEGAGSVSFFPHVVTSLGEYLSKEAGLSPGDSMAYLIGPPIESIVALDAALKAARVKSVRQFLPPTETNRGGAFLSGPLEECQAAAHAFAATMADMAARPLESLDRRTR